MANELLDGAVDCPCGRAGRLPDCCGPYLAGERAAPDPESLMRSRYTAFALGSPQCLEYLVTTHHPATRGSELREGLRASIAAVDAWVGLRVQSASVDGEQGSVAFVATYRVGERVGRLRERSEFVREDGRWLYVSGVTS